MDNYFDTKEWLSQRLGRFTASEINKLFIGSKTKGQEFGQVAIKYIRTKAAEILTQEVKEEVNFKQAEWGKSNEAEACTFFENFTGISGTYYGAGNPKFFPHGEFEGGSPDWESVDATVGADFKCPYDSAEHILNLMLQSAADLEEERWEYYCQLQHSMYRRGWKHAFFISYDPRMALDAQKMKIIVVYPDQAWRAKFDVKIESAVTELKSIINKVLNGGQMAIDQPAVNQSFDPSALLQKI